MVESIPELMHKDHLEILSLLTQFEAVQKSRPAQSVRAFDAFDWKLEKHMLVEERVLFGYTTFSRSSNSIIHQVLDEHKLLLDMVKALQRRLSSGVSDMDVSDFREFLDRHRMFEETELYPKLDSELDAKAKQFVMDQLKVRMA